MKKLTLKCFSQLSRVKKFIPRKQLKEVEEKRQRLEESDRFEENMSMSNTNEMEVVKDKNIYYPRQHPKQLYNEDTSIISYKPPVMNLTEYHRVPGEVLLFDPPEFESPMDSKALDIGILGPANAGKSSLINKLVGSNISAVSPKYGTTYDKVEGVYTDINEKIQLVLFDTPGATKVSKSVRSRKIITRAWTVIPDCDKV